MPEFDENPGGETTFKKLGTETLLALIFVLLAIRSEARPVSEAEATVAAKNWLARQQRPLGTSLSAGQTKGAHAVRDETGAALFHVVRMENGGFVVTSAETGVAPVIAISNSGELVESNGNPLFAILAADMSNRLAQVSQKRAESATRTASTSRNVRLALSVDQPFATEEAAWAELLGDATDTGESAASSTRLRSTSASQSTLSDVRVAPLLQTKWGQEGNAANYYTPNGSPCGCVALVGAQIAKFWQFPTASRSTVTRKCSVSGTSRLFTTMGGTYAWSAMPESFSSLSLSQRQAIGKLCYDFGVATYMDWDQIGSGTGVYCLADAFTTVFGYANSRVYCQNQDTAFDEDTIKKAILANLDAGCPVPLGIASHAIVADGYGYSSSTLFTHLNMGWEGSYDAWYNLPTVNTFYQSSILDVAVYNICPQQTGDLLTGRVLSADGNPIPGAEVVAECNGVMATAETGPNGIYALWVTGGRTWSVCAKSYGSLATIRVDVKACVSTPVQGDYYYLGGVVGNSWGNDIVLSLPSQTVPTVPTSPGNDDFACASPLRGPSGSTSGTSVNASRENGEPEHLGRTTDSVWWRWTAPGNGTAIFDTNGSDFDTVLAVYTGTSVSSLSTVMSDDDGGDGNGASRCAFAVTSGTIYSIAVAGYSSTGGISLNWSWKEAAPPLALPDAVNNQSLSLATGGEAGWFGQRDEASDGVGAAQSGTISHGGSSWLTATVTGEGTIAFWWKVSSEEGYDCLQFFVDDVWITEISGLTSWASASTAVSGHGRHTIKWVYSKDSNVSANSDCGWIDRIVWTPKPVQRMQVVTFDACGGVCPTARQTYVMGGTYSALPTPTYRGHVFDGWFTAASGGTRVSPSTAVSVATSEKFFAHWTPVTSMVTFSANGGRGKMAAQTMTYGMAATLSKNAFTRKGWVFAGWAVSAADAKQGLIAFTDAQLVTNPNADGQGMTLYAVWAKKNYKVAFNANGGKGTMAVESFTYGKAKKLSANKFKAPKGKKKFAGWAKSKADAKKGQIAYKNKAKVKNLIITGKTVKLYAVWKK